MAEKLEASTGIKTPADKYFDFFKYNLNELVKLVPGGVNGVEVIKGEEGTVGSVKKWSIVVGGISQSMTLETTAIDDAAKSITFKAVAGDVLFLYKTYQFTVSVSDGLVTWTIIYDKALFTSPPPAAYVALGILISTLVDAYLIALK